MKTSTRLFWLITLLTFLSGCSGYRNFQLPAKTDPQEKVAAPKNIKVGAFIRVTMQTGEINEGILQSIEPKFIEVLLSESGGISQTYFAQDVQKLEFYDEVSPLVHLGVATVAIGAFVFGYFMVHNAADFNPADPAKIDSD